MEANPRIATYKKNIVMQKLFCLKDRQHSPQKTVLPSALIVVIQSSYGVQRHVYFVPGGEVPGIDNELFAQRSLSYISYLKY